MNLDERSGCMWMKNLMKKVTKIDKKVEEDRIKETKEDKMKIK